MAWKKEIVCLGMQIQFLSAIYRYICVSMWVDHHPMKWSGSILITHFGTSVKVFSEKCFWMYMYTFIEEQYSWRGNLECNKFEHSMSSTSLYKVSACSTPEIPYPPSPSALLDFMFPKQLLQSRNFKKETMFSAWRIPLRHKHAHNKDIP